jgi:hypothetical protein
MFFKILFGILRQKTRNSVDNLMLSYQPVLIKQSLTHYKNLRDLLTLEALILGKELNQTNMSFSYTKSMAK